MAIYGKGISEAHVFPGLTTGEDIPPLQKAVGLNTITSKTLVISKNLTGDSSSATTFTGRWSWSVAPPAKGQLWLSAPVITAHFCVKQTQRRPPRRACQTPASEMIMKWLREVWRGKSKPKKIKQLRLLYKSLQKMIIDAEINLTIIGWGETFQINRFTVSHITWQLIIMITPGLSQKMAYLLVCNRWEACVFLAYGSWNWSFGGSINMMNWSP